MSKEKLVRGIKITDQRIGLNLANADPASHVAKIQVPVLYVAGSSDHIAPASSVRMLASRTYDTRFVSIPRYTHIGLYTDVHRVGTLMLEAVQKTLGKAADSACLDTLIAPTKLTHYEVEFTLKFKQGSKIRPAADKK